MLLTATHTHLYPGLRGTISGSTDAGDLQTDRDCLVEFADGTAAMARISNLGEGWQLNVDAYRTAAGTEIRQKSWRLEIERIDETIRFRIVEKIRDEARKPGLPPRP